jgi:hypothetical protein
MSEKKYYVVFYNDKENELNTVPFETKEEIINHMQGYIGSDFREEDLHNLKYEFHVFYGEPITIDYTVPKKAELWIVHNPEDKKEEKKCSCYEIVKDINEKCFNHSEEKWSHNSNACRKWSFGNHYMLSSKCVCPVCHRIICDTCSY